MGCEQLTNVPPATRANWFSFLQQPSVIVSSIAWSGAFRTPLYSILEILSLLVLWRSCAGNHSYCELIFIITTSCLDTSLSQYSSLSSKFYDHSSHFLWCSMSFGAEVIKEFHPQLNIYSCWRFSVLKILLF